MEKKFKKGDRVRFIGDCVYQGVSYNEFTVTEDSDDKHTDVIHYVKEELCFDNDELELVEPFDKKTAFLTELKELMERYQACINLSWNDYFDKDNAPCIDIDIELKGEKNNGYIGVCYSDMLNKAITSSNIFDYDDN